MLWEVGCEMDVCICNNCNNLKCILSENGISPDYSCEFGFPSENCLECDEETCGETCSNFEADDEKVEIKTVFCKVCGKALEKVLDEETDEGDVYCIDCYLKMD